MSSQETSKARSALSVDVVDILSSKMNVYAEISLPHRRSLEFGVSWANRSYLDEPISYRNLSVRHKWFLPFLSNAELALEGLYVAGGLGYDRYRRQSQHSSSYFLEDAIDVTLDLGSQWLLKDRFKVDVFVGGSMQYKSTEHLNLEEILQSKDIFFSPQIGLRIGMAL